MAAIARLQLTALECPDPDVLAAFYSRVTGWPVADRSDHWVTLASDEGATLAFQRDPDHRPPVWPSTDDSQQAHLDFQVADLDRGEQQVLEIGARKATWQPHPDDFRVFLDPAGHPFCLVRAA